MKKNTTKIFIAAIFLTISGTAYAQEGRVGINTSTPAATLDVTASPSILTRIDGFIAPRLKGSELDAKDGLYTTAQDGAIVYVTEAVSGGKDKTTNVTSIGYYYFDKTQSTGGRWMKIANPTAVGAYKEPWNQAGTSTPADANNQAIYQSGAVSIWRNKVFESTASGSAKVDLHVNGATRVGGQDPDVAKSVGGNSFAGGNAPVASGNNSMAYGTSVEASGTNSAAFGYNSKAVGTESIAMGNNTTATGAQSFAGGGNGSTATGQYAFAFGNNAQAKANHAVAMGVGTVAPARSSATFGRYNVNTFTSPDIALNSPGDPIFQVGSGPDDARRYNIITTFLGTNGTTGVGGGWMAIGGDLNTMPVKVQDETLRVYGGALANKAYVTDINYVTGAATDKIVVADATTGQLKTIKSSSIAPTITSNNGLTKTGDNIQLGGDLVESTSIGTNDKVTLALTGLQTGAVTDKIVVASRNGGVLKAIDISSLPNSTYQEPWNQAGGTTPATTNSQAIYQNGAVSIWRNKVFESTASGSAKVDLHVNGATRIGTTDPAVTKKVGASSFAGGSSAVASGNNSMAYGTSVEASGLNSAALGNSNVSSGNSSFTAGTSNIAGGISSVALGSENQIDSTANFSIVGGLSNLIKNSSYSAVVLGTRNKIDQSANAMAAGTENIIGSKASAYASIALGSGNSIDSNYGAAIGLSNIIGSKASAKESIAQGSHNSIDSDYSVAIGVHNEIGQYSNSSFALGQNARIAGTATDNASNTYNSYALGYKATVGYDSVDGTTVTGANSAYAIGSEALANGKYSYAIGYRANAKAYGAIAIGTQSNINVSKVASTVASERNSIAIGSGIDVSKPYNTAIGSYNIAGLDASFAVGIGNDIDSRKNGLMVFKNGRAAIGSYSSLPSFDMEETLQVNGGALADKAYVKDINNVKGAATDKLVVADPNTGQLKTISATGASVSYKEPWNIQESTIPSTSNNDAIYQTGNVAIGRAKGYTSDAKTVRLDVQGEVRTGAGHKGSIGANSVAMGLYNTASGANSVAMGLYNTASGANSVAMGNSNTASGDNSVAFGNTAEASGIESFAAGSTTKASGIRSFATGWKTEVTGDNSAGFGYNNTVKGVNSVAMGNGSTVKTNQSFAGGTGSTVTYSKYNTGDNSIAFGDVAQAVAASSAAFGKNTFANGEQSLVFGNGASATGNYSFAGGNSTQADGIGSVAFGNGSLAVGNYSFAFGDKRDVATNTMAEGDYSFAFGHGATARLRHAVAIGVGTFAPVRSGVALGRYNAYTVDYLGKDDKNKPGDPIFQVGQGVSSTNRSNIITGFYGNGEDGSYGPGWVVIGSRTDLAAGSTYFDSPRIGSSATLSVYGDYASNGKMNIVGAMRADGGFYSSASQTIYADYVFENYVDKKSNINPSYKMMSLTEVDQFIKENKHLPGVTGINELPTNENGHKEFELSKLSTQTLEKVEELYLHTIEQQKQIDELKDIVKQQQKQIDQLLKK